MTIRSKILAFQLVLAAMLLGAAAATWFAIERIDYYFDRNRLAGAQLDTVIRLSAAMNRYSENVAELLLLGRTELDDFTEARDSLEASFARLEDLIQLELDLIRSPAERTEESREVDRLADMRALYEDIDLRTQRLLFLRDQNRLDEAVRIFRDDIEERFDAELETIISAAIADEEAELAEISDQTNRLESQLVWVIVSVCLAALLVAGAAGALLTRALTRPITALTDATQAIGEGDLGHRISYTGRDEFADLAAQFNIAAGRLQAQRSALLEVQSGLESEVARRTGELEETNRRLQRLDHMRLLFLADVGHELRTPLTVIRGEAEVALRNPGPSEVHVGALGRIVTITEQMGRLIEDLLFLSRAEVGAVRFEIERVVFQDLLDLALGEARVLASANGLLIAARIPDEDLAIDGDAQRLVQALLIALDNAVKYSDDGEQIEVDVRPGEGELVVTIANVGPEIPPADIPFVFNRFYRGSQSPSRKTAGSGLGLPIAKWIVETHGGRMSLTSADRRTVVTIRLPLAPEAR